MNAVCLVAAALSAALPLEQFTLAWTHSIEKIRWEEDYRISDRGLHLVEARIRGSGAGMEPPEGAVLRSGVWHYRPALPVLPRLHLARSEYVTDYELCTDTGCQPFATLVGAPDRSPEVELFPCMMRK